MNIRLITPILVGFLLSALILNAQAVTIKDAKITQNPNPRVPLAWICTFKTDVPAKISAVLFNGRERLMLPTKKGYATDHEIIVLGVRPGRENMLGFIAIDEIGTKSDAERLKWTVGPLPEEMPVMDVYAADPKRMEPGITLIPCNRWSLKGLYDITFGALLGLNAYGDVVWSYQTDHTIVEAKPLKNGNLLIHYGREGHVMEIDMLGNTVRRWHTTLIPKKYYEGSIPIEAQTIHHEVLEMPNGNFMALSTEVRYFERYPDSEFDPDVPEYPAYVVGDVIIEYKPDGTIVKQIKLLDLLDAKRIGYDSLSQGFWSDIYYERGLLSARPVDWSHANSLDYNPNDNTLLVSINHQDAVIKIDYETGKVKWVMGYPSDWRGTLKLKLLKPTGEGHFFFHQHTARMTPVGTMMLFDNGSYRARPFEPRLKSDKNFSRVVEFEIDEKNNEYKEVWSYGGRQGEYFFSPILSEAEWLPRTQNVLITDGARIRRPDGTTGGHPKQGKEWARVLEVTRTKPAEKVFEVVLDDPKWGWTIYRSERIPSLYPKGATLVPKALPENIKMLSIGVEQIKQNGLPEIQETDEEALDSLPYL